MENTIANDWPAGRARRGFLSACVAIAYLAPAGFLGWMSLGVVRDGVAWDKAVPVPVYITSHKYVPRAAYLAAADDLSGASPDDSQAGAFRVEAMLNAGAPPNSLMGEAGVAVRSGPANARSWLVLSKTSVGTDRKLAAQSVGVALMLAPHDYFLLAPILAQAAILWSDLDQETQLAVLAGTRLLWTEPLFRVYLIDLQASAEGRGLIGRAFPPDTVRLINRWVLSERLSKIKSQ